MKVQTGTRYYYPDVTLTCEPIKLESDTFYAPCAVFEVLSPGTESRDRGVKFRAYTLPIPSLESIFWSRVIFRWSRSTPELQAASGRISAFRSRRM